MAGKSCRILFIDGAGVPSFPHTLFFLVCSGVPRSRLSSESSLAHPPLCLSATLSIKLGGAFLGPQMFVSIFFLESLTTLEDQPVCHIYRWVAHPTDGSVYNHCNRMMDGFTIDDLISGSGTGSLTEDDVVA